MGCCCAGVVYTLWQISLRFWTVEILRKVKLERLKFNKSIKIYKRVKLMDADVWDLPPFDYTVINSVIGNVKYPIEGRASFHIFLFQVHM